MSSENSSNTFPPKSLLGDQFEDIALAYFYKEKGILLNKQYKLEIGLGLKKWHCFDLGNESTVVECKLHTWTKGDNVPSAKLTIWNEAMYYFHLAPVQLQKIFFVLKDFNVRRAKTLLQYYLETYYHLIPNDVIFYEYDMSNKTCEIFKAACL